VEWLGLKEGVDFESLIDLVGGSLLADMKIKGFAWHT
jgi:hypothetical protein